MKQTSVNNKKISNDIKHEAFIMLNDEFTSHEFGKHIRMIFQRENGFFPDWKLRTYDYLAKRAKQTSLRRWVKNTAKATSNDIEIYSINDLVTELKK
jgi:hypothetical protein